MSKKLTREFIALKAKSDRLQSITKLNLWGSDLDEVSILQQMPLLEVVSLSVNKLSTLKDFADMENLRELYLRNNLISDIREVKYLSTWPNLRVLSLNENPIANMKGYRQTILRMLPNLTKFDEVLVTEAEKNNTYDNDTEESLSARILEQEHLAYSEAVSLYAEGLLEIEGRKVIIRK